ncbi:preprotein translocase subunit SECE1 [Dendrobium catenatum]|uniref:Preprotein translocase subunit SECE1 n=1 Tax=Dendrobium catenatum TaxID=906689 RepID=A0A2I0VNE7_9ASPA|nr:preprotein translocase subunit SECE1 [Dendrobium catenatum]PKU64930.1 Preprotein translocase subunit SECE1 [Dendrobium catenatum]
MAASISFSRFLAQSPPSALKNFNRPLIVPARLIPAPLSLRKNATFLRCRFSAQENNDGAAENLAEKKDDGAVEEKKTVEVAAEIREMMASRKEERSKADELLAGVADEVREIEWPEFGKVVGTTGVVLAVIAGSSIALLTVNAILAELSDRVFAGKGVQDFFSG